MLKQLIWDALANVPETRSSDSLLYKTVAGSFYAGTLGFPLGKDINDLFFGEWMRLVHKGWLPDLRTVIRWRALLQQNHPELRDINWKDRQKFSKTYHEQVLLGRQV